MALSRNFNFIRSVFNRGSVSQNVQPKTFVVEPNLVGANTVYFNLTSNFPNETLYYTIAGASSTDFVENSVSGSITTDGTGNASISRALIPDVNLNQGNKKFNVAIRAYSITGEVRAISSNVLINKFEYPTATGGTVTFPNPTTKVHTFLSNSTFSVSSLGDATSANLWSIVVGGGGAGGGYLNPAGPASTITAVHAGGGGGGGSVIQNNTTISVGNISIGIGSGGNANIRQNGFSTTFGNVTAPGGGAGGAVTLYDQTRADTPVTNTSTQNNGVTGANGGGGASKARRNTFRTLSDPTYFNEIINGTGAASNVGGFSGGNSVAFGPFSAFSDLDYVLNYLGTNLQFSTYPSATAGGGGAGAGGDGQNGRIINYNANNRTYQLGSGGEGGIGALTFIDGISTRFAGGGSGGSGFRMPGAFATAGPGGDGGGGNGIKWSPSNLTGDLTFATNGSPNSGGGGGGGIVVSGLPSVTYRPGNGGSGIVKVRYEWDNPRKLALE
jgi:hypothetical protein